MNTASDLSLKPAVSQDPSKVEAIQKNLDELLESLSGLTGEMANKGADMDAAGDLEGEDSEQLKMLMAQIDSTFDALGALETRAEDVLSKMDAFLAESGIDVSSTENNDAEVEGTSK
ncbi:hypothetical protein HDU81_001198 [Chytriomyces hyalinus]|nr:hypothetical protein HDU81_001198 [Chytriomyces hyalinus]